MNAPSVVLALVAGFLFAIGSVLQQRGTMQEPDAKALSAGFLLRLLRKPIWLLGVVADGAGYVAQAGALGVGKLVVVQPLMVTSVVFALPLGAWLTRQRIGRRDWLGAVAVTVGLAVFMTVANPSGGRTDARLLDWVVAGAAIGGVAAALTVAAVGRSPGVRATLLGTAAGVLFGFVAALTKSTVDRFDNGFEAVFFDWHIYALAAASLAGFMLVQASLQTGTLAPAIATSMVFETVVGIVVGIVLLGEELHEDTWGIAVSAVGLALVIGGVVVLARSLGAAEEQAAALEPAAAT
jgi:drug/metabolite transporter (DMT)-like permease